MLTSRLKETLFTGRCACLLSVLIATLALLAVLSQGSQRYYADRNQTVVPSEVLENESSSESDTPGEEYEIHGTGDEPVNVSRTRPTSEAIADQLIAALKARIGEGLGPFIVGGVGDSGTRGAHNVLLRMGVQMVEHPYVKRSQDSLLFMSAYSTHKSNGKIVSKRPGSLYSPYMMRAHSLIYNQTHGSFDSWHTSRQFIALCVDRSLSICLNLKKRRGGGELGNWGFKHPRTSLLLPFWLATLDDKFVFVHVIRDGKDIVKGDNQKLFHDRCATYYGVQHCGADLRTRLNFWADLNRDIFQFALHSKMKAHQYIPVRIEDLVTSNNPKCFRRFAHYLNITEDHMDQLISKAMASGKGHEGSYLGRKWDKNTQHVVIHAAKHDEKAQTELQFWGYGNDSYGLKQDCEELEWLKLMREAKGPLPGDDDGELT